MVKSHNSDYKNGRHAIISFIRADWAYALILTIAMIVLTYKDIVYLRFISDTVGNGFEAASNVQQLLLDRFSYNLVESLSRNLPIFVILIMASLLVYSLMNSYKKTYTDLQVNSEYVNIKKQPVGNIMMKSILLRSCAFAVPLLFWFAYVFLWFPQIVKLPLQYVLKGHVPTIALYSMLTIAALFLLTHAGLITSKLAIRFLRRA